MKHSLTLTSFAALIAAAPLAAAQSQDQPFPEVSARPGAVFDPSPDGAVVPPTRPTFYTANALPNPTATDDAAPMDTSALASRHDRFYFDHDGEAHWVRGRTYKARAGADGFTYIPFLGSKASQSYPLAMRVSGATVGGAPLELLPAANVAREGESYVLDRGPVDVRYELALDSVEQIFVVQTGAATGDLRVTIDLETELVAGRLDSGFRFTGPEGGVNVSGAVAIDGSGNALPIESHVRGGQLVLTVPSDFVAQSNGQVVIDPVFQSYQIFDNPTEVRDVDVAFQGGENVFGYVFEDPFSATDNDVYIATFGGNSGALEDGRYIDFTTMDVHDPEAASLQAEDVMLVVATNIEAGADDEIVGRIYDIAAQSTPNGLFVIGDTGGDLWTNARPDVGGNSSSTAGQRFLVTWERTFDSSGSKLPRFTTVDAAGNVGSLGTVLQPSGNDLECTWFRCSESTGQPASVNVWNVTYSQRNTATGDEELRIAQLNADGSVASAVDVAVSSAANEDFETIDISDAIEIDGLAPTYLVVYDDFATAPPDVDAVICRGNNVVNRVDINESEHANQSLNQNYPKLATTADEFVVTYIEFEGGEWSTYATSLDLSEGSFLAISERRTLLGAADPGIGTD